MKFISKKEKGSITKEIMTFTAFLLISMIITYAVFLEKSVRLAGEANRMQSLKKELVATVSELEYQYEKSRGIISIDEAKSLGYSDSNIIFISEANKENVAIAEDGK